MISRPFIAAAVIGLVTLSGCGSSPPTEIAPAQLSQPTTVLRTEPKSNPTDVWIDRIDAHSSLIPLGLAADGSHVVPDVSNPLQAAWFEPGPEPGQDGPAILLGHIDGGGRQGIFYRLRELKPGDAVRISMSTGAELKYIVTKVERVDKDSFPSERVYGETAGSEIRIITCGGVFDKKARSYEDNIIVYGMLARASPSS